MGGSECNRALVLKNSARRRISLREFLPVGVFLAGSLFLTRLPSQVALSG